MPMTRSRRSLAKAGARVITPYLRGFGPTRFLSGDTMRSGQQAALGRDLIDLLDALGIQRAILAGYDWGGLSSCVASALWPERVTGLVSYAGYDIIDVQATSARLRSGLGAGLLVSASVSVGARTRVPDAASSRLVPHPLAAMVARLDVQRRYYSRGRLRHSTIRTSSMSSSTAIASVSGWRQATRLWMRSRRGSPRGPRSASPR